MAFSILPHKVSHPVLLKKLQFLQLLPLHLFVGRQIHLLVHLCKESLETFVLFIQLLELLAFLPEQFFDLLVVQCILLPARAVESLGTLVIRSGHYLFCKLIGILYAVIHPDTPVRVS